MPLSTARFTTSDPDRHLARIVERLKPDAQVTGPGRAKVTLAGGDCSVLAAGDEVLVIAAAADAGGLASVQEEIGRQLLAAAGDVQAADVQAGDVQAADVQAGDVQAADVQAADVRAGEGERVAWAEAVSGEQVELVSPIVEDYLLAHCTPADEVLRELAATTREVTGRSAGMQVSADEGALLSMLARMVGARRAIEVGVFTGYSSLCIARALPADGKLIACDVSTEWTDIARPFWKRAGVADRIELRIGPAVDTLRALPDEPAFDFAFVDADKPGYPAYYEEIVPRLRPGGLLVLDNVFLGGRVLDPAFQGAAQVAMRQVNDAIARDERLDSVMLPVRDGVTLARKR
ncbi:class I SAM-dependent methyltransferase [Nonomuraea sp. NPDC004580]|uniref:O-methyltransferase n=1 Tax=Nonomuraea sp. NPDC004580 TaxID=3154552 RepID=UPI0033AEE45B